MSNEGQRSFEGKIFMINEVNGKVSWNIAASQSQLVFTYIKKSMTYYQNGNLAKWYWTLSSLRELINYALSGVQRDNLDEMEKKVQNSLKYWSKFQAMRDGHDGNHLSRAELYKKNLFATYVRTYQRQLMDLLNKLGYFPSKEDRSKLTF